VGSTSIRDRYARVRSHSEALAAPLSAEDQTVQSMPDVSPTKWHRAHVTWFFETFVLAGRPWYQVFDPAFGYLFNSYYEAVGPRHPRPARGLVTRPGVAEVAAYRSHVDDAMSRLLEDELEETMRCLVELGMHHEQQHQELLLMDIKHVFSCNSLLPMYAPAAPHPRPGAAGSSTGWSGSEGGVMEIGHEGDGFCFDNESPRHSVLLAPFEIARGVVTNGDWLAFVADGGYRRAELWLSDGWYAVNGEGWEAPLYWRGDDSGRWSEFTLSGLQPLDPDRPVSHVSYYEADAFARWAGTRLPTEAEWETAAADGDLNQAFGEVWQWTASAYLPYPGFRAAPGAVGEYNGKFMVNQHVLRGSSCLTPEGHERVTYRNFFPPSARWACSGVRLARDPA
jgi:ergothioneine biosynthesis protein EgtB